MDTNRFTVDLVASLRGSFPIPSTLSPDAAELLTKWLAEAFWADANLNQRTHRVICVASRELEDLANEILRTPFAMPCEGTDEPICTIEHVDLQPSELTFTISDLYATYLLYATPEDVQSRNRGEATRLLPLEETYRPLIVGALRSHHMQLTMAWTEVAIFSCRKGQRPPARDSFRLRQIEIALAALGASVAP